MLLPSRRRRPFLHLRRNSRAPVWVSLLWRILLVLVLIAIAVAIQWIDRSGLRDNVDGEVSFADIIYFTMITITTVGYGDIVPVTTRARLFDALLLTPIRLFLWLIFLGTAYDFVLRHLWEKWRMGMIQRNLRGHTVVAGHGTSGAEAVSELLRRGTSPDSIVVVDPRTLALEAAAARGLAVLEGDATRNATLEAVQINRAASLIVSAGRDDTSVLIVLTARRLAPHVPISVVIRAEDNEPLARQAGADTVINPASFAGLLLAGSTNGRHIAAYLADLASAGGSISLRERQVTPDEVGRPLTAIQTGLGVRVYRKDRYFSFSDPEIRSLQPGDTIVEIVSHRE
ncbi:potassium channel family protein [Roseomonas marmotae]|uniref:Potassium channel family protein n=1 Tax=Roseomonas marmotae TaxID=2768161 RepID=A0ABS3K8T4_9PROT|nr:potassium channel family protein [Roseomonas marmotae]MBO1073870.1 potassium channel family protein [Roseomonas marmotae]QTI78507.1 potassium channel family protein [Roseomonas marmotae]